MLDPANDLLPPALSPTNSTPSSSDLDTESTGSFFHDRSTTLGTLMGVNFPAITFRAPSQHNQVVVANATPAVTAAGGRRSRTVSGERRRWRRSRRRKWWGLCTDEGWTKPSSLGEFLEEERRFGDAASFYGAAAELEGVGGDIQPTNGRLLFADGRILPPVELQVQGSSSSDGDGGGGGGALCRFPVSLTGICSGGGG